MTLKLDCQSGASKFNTEYETASEQLYETPGLDTIITRRFIFSTEF
jgi:hypothetical protein